MKLSWLFLIALGAIGPAYADTPWLNIARRIDPQGQVRLHLAVRVLGEENRGSVQEALGPGAYFVPGRLTPAYALAGLLRLSGPALDKLEHARADQSWPTVRLVLAHLEAGTVAVTTRDQNFARFLGLGFGEVPLVVTPGLEESLVDHQLQNLADLRARLDEQLARELAWVPTLEVRRGLVEFALALRGYRAEFETKRRHVATASSLLEDFWARHGERAAALLAKLPKAARPRALTVLRAHSLAGDDSSFYRAVIERLAPPPRANFLARCAPFLLP